MGSGLRLSRGLCALVAALVLISVAPQFVPQPAHAATSLHYLYGSGSATGGKKITLRVELTEPAPATGKRVAITSSHRSIPVPTSVKVPAGETELTISITTKPVANDVGVTVTARVGTVSKSRVVVVKAPVLNGLSVQSRIRAGGVGKVTVMLSGRAPDEGVTIELESNRPSILSVPATAVVIAGRSSVSLTAAAELVKDDVTVRVTARLDGDSRTRSTIVRNYGDPVDPTATPTATATETGTATPSPTSTATLEIPTATASATPSHTATPTQTATATTSPDELLTITLTSGSATVPKGSSVAFNVCLTFSPAAEEFVSFSSNNPSVALDSGITPTQWVYPAGASGTGQCVTVSMAGRTDAADPQGVGEVNLKVNWDGADILSEPITFLAIPPTATETSTPSATVTESATSAPTATETSTPAPTVTTVPTSTATDVVTSTATLEPTATYTPVATNTNTPDPTATETATTVPTSTNTSTATATNTSTATGTASPTLVPTATATSTPTATATSTATHTATIVPGDPLTITITSGAAVVERGATVAYRACVLAAPASVNFSSSNSSVVLDEAIVVVGSSEPPGLWIVPAGATGSGLCTDVQMTGRTDGTELTGVGPVQLRGNLNAIYYLTDVVTFVAPPTATPTETSVPTATQTPTPSATPSSTPTVTATATETSIPTQTHTPTATATDVPTATPTDIPTSTLTPTPEPTATSTPSPTATVQVDPIAIVLTSGSDVVPRGSTVTFDVCLSPTFVGQAAPSLSSSEELVVESAGLVPVLVLQPGECGAVSMTGRVAGFGSIGVGTVQLRAFLGGEFYLGPVITFVAEP